MKRKYRKPASEVRKRMIQALRQRSAGCHGKASKVQRRDCGIRLRQGQWDSRNLQSTVSAISLAYLAGARA